VSVTPFLPPSLEKKLSQQKHFAAGQNKENKMRTSLPQKGGRGKKNKLITQAKEE
jgi:hypothetical protein